MPDFRVSITAIVSLESPAQLHAWVEGELNRICEVVAITIKDPTIRLYTPDPELAGGMMDGNCLHCSEPENRHKFGTKECLK
jgi:hypothetical protein